MGRTNLMRRYDATLKAAALDGLRFHDLRHTYCSILTAAGEAQANIQAWVGHADGRITERDIHALAPKHDAAARVSAASLRWNAEGICRWTVRGPF